MEINDPMSDNQDLVIAITKIGGKMDAMHKRFDTHEEMTTTMLTKHNDVLYGNGKAGVLTEVSNIQQWRQSVAGKLKFWGSIAGSVFVITIVGYFGLR